jgi:hypothetical protein
VSIVGDVALRVVASTDGGVRVAHQRLEGATLVLHLAPAAATTPTGGALSPLPLAVSDAEWMLPPSPVPLLARVCSMAARARSATLQPPGYAGVLSAHDADVGMRGAAGGDGRLGALGGGAGGGGGGGWLFGDSFADVEGLAPSVLTMGTGAPGAGYGPAAAVV